NVVTFVHGLNSNHFAGWALKTADAMVADAAQADPNATTSVIAWLDYDAPFGIDKNLLVPTVMPDGSIEEILGPSFNGLLQAGSLHYARQAANDLRRFQDGLAATHQSGTLNRTVLGHSYGSVVVGYTAAEDESLGADQLILV